jgi:hypothetical protein
MSTSQAFFVLNYVELWFRFSKTDPCVLWKLHGVAPFLERLALSRHMLSAEMLQCCFVLFSSL